MARKPSRRDDVASHDIAAADVVSAGTASAAAAEAVVRSSSAGIVSSAHLVSSRSPELSEFEFGLNTAYNAYSRWVVRCMGAAGVRDLTFLDVDRKSVV